MAPCKEPFLALLFLNMLLVAKGFFFEGDTDECPGALVGGCTDQVVGEGGAEGVEFVGELGGSFQQVVHADSISRDEDTH